MSFSPLTPRNNRNGDARVRSGKRPTRRAPRHLRLWEAIRLTRDELSQWQHRAEQVDRLFRQHILPRETRFTSVYSALTDKLMDRYAEGRLSSAHQALLALWITDNLRSLSVHPFLSVEQRESLVRRWQTVQTAEVLQSGADLSRTGSRTSRDPHDMFDEDDELDDEDIVFDFGWHKTATPSSRSTSEDASGTGPFRDAQDDVQAAPGPGTADSAAQDDEQPDDETVNVDARVSELEKRLSVDRLFRQLARVLHPDREQDEALKVLKHELMSQCLQARQNKDINTLLTLYCEHIGDLPDDLSSSDHDDLITALQLQLRQLQHELRQERFADPLRVQIIERYSNGDEALTLQRVMDHAQSLDNETVLLNAQLSELDSDASLDAALELRREIELDRRVIDQMTGYT